MPSRAGPSSRSGGNEKRKTISLGMTMKWSPTLTTDLLDLIKANPDWRHTFFSRDSAKGHQWKEARDVLCQLCRKQEHGLMRRMEHFGLVKNSGRAEGGGIVWKPRDKWNRADIVTNRAESQLRRLRDDYDKMRAEHSIPDTVTTWKDIDKNIRGSLKSLNPFFIAVHNLRKYDDALTSHPLPANLVAGPSRTASSSRRLKEKPVPVKRRARASSSASSSGSSSVVIIDRPVVKRAKTELRSPSPHPRTRPIGTAPQEETDRKPNIALSTDTAPKRRLLTTMVDRPDVRYHSLEEAMNPAFGTKHRAPAENSLLSDTDSGTSSSTQSDIDPDELHERSSEAHEMSYCDGHIADMAMPDYKDVEGPEHTSTSPGSHLSGSRSAASSARQGGSNRTTMSPANGLLSTSVPVQPALQPRIQIRDSVIQHTYDLPAGIPKEELLAIARDTSEEHPVVRPDTAVDGRLRLRMSNLPRGSRTSMGMHRDNRVAIYIALWSRETAMRELLRILPIRHYNFARHPVNGRGGALGSDSRRLFGVTRAVFIELGRRDKRLRRGKFPGTALRINGLSDPLKPVDDVDLATAERCNMMEFWRAIDRLVQSLPPDVQRRMVR